jgi:integrase
LIDQHLASITLAGHRPRSIDGRRKVLRAFSEQLRPDTLLRAKRPDVEMFLARPLAPRSRQVYLAHLRGYYRWALDNDLIRTDPTVKIPSVRIPRSVPRPISPDDLALAVDQAPMRMRAWLLLMSLAGLRCCEVAVLRPQDLTEDRGVWLLFLRETKGGGSAMVPAHPAVVEALACLPIHGGLWWQVSASHVSTTTNAYLHGKGISATAHQLRHAAGTAWYKASGHDLLTTARLLRHANVATTQGYAELDPVRPAQVVNLVPLPSAS